MSMSVSPVSYQPPVTPVQKTSDEQSEQSGVQESGGGQDTPAAAPSSSNQLLDIKV